MHWVILYTCQVTAKTSSRIQMFFWKKGKKKNINTYFNTCITCIQKKGTAKRWLEEGAVFYTPE